VLCKMVKRLTNPHNSPGLTTSLTPPLGPFTPSPIPIPALGDPGVFTVDNLFVEFTPGVDVGVNWSCVFDIIERGDMVGK
jgi:hypothetical protein